MAQTPANQAKAQQSWATGTMKAQRANEKAQHQVASALKPNVPMGATSHNTSALRRNKVIENIKGSSPASLAGLGV